MCEQEFSAMARIRSDWHTRLAPKMLNFLMAVSIYKALNSWITMLQGIFSSGGMVGNKQRPKIK